MQVTSNYDSLIAKVIVWSEERQTTIRRLRRALTEYQIGGIPTDIDFLIQIIDSESFIQGSANTTYLDTFLPTVETDENLDIEIALAAALLEHKRNHNMSPSSPGEMAGFWKYQAWKEQMR
jgi:acetyl/propionyl-CoA carboxylase alpha subunit